MAEIPFPTSEAGISQWLKTAVTKLPGYKTELGISNPELSRIAADSVNFDYLVSMSAQIDDTKDAFYQYKRTILNGELIEPLPTPPAFSSISLPDTGAVGIVTFAKFIWQRSKKAGGYTTQIGEDLGWISNDELETPEQITAALTSLKALSNSRVEMTFSKQGQDAMKILFKRQSESKYSLAGVYTASPAIHEEDPLDPDTPESRQYKGILMKKNEEIGNESPIYTVVTTP